MTVNAFCLKILGKPQSRLRKYLSVSIYRYRYRYIDIVPSFNMIICPIQLAISGNLVLEKRGVLPRRSKAEKRGC